jgi:hypothetical protein
MQSFKEINGQDNIKNSRTTINDSIKTVMSNNSGTAFPTTNLQVGMKCYRTDLGKTYTLIDVANKTWKEDNHATLADSANKLSGLTVAGSNDSQAITNKIPKIDGSGVMEVGKYIDFHSTNKQTTDYTARITANDDGTISVSGGINATLKGNASSASSVPWAGVTGKPSTYPPSGHNHDSAYPAINGSRATGTWGINITGSSASCTGNAKTASSCTGNSSTANTAGKIGEGGNTNNPITFHWSGQKGQPTWVWGGNDRANQYVYNPSNFSVNYASSAGSANAVAWGNVSSKPVSIVKVASWDGSTLNLTTCT